jgi:hypothetical protein
MTFEQKIQMAEGYAELGMYDEALAELDQIDPERQDVVELLRMRVELALYKARLEVRPSIKPSSLPALSR